MAFSLPHLGARGGALCVLLALGLGLVACGGDDDPSGPGNQTVATIQVRHGGSAPADMSLQAIGDTAQLTAVALDDEGNSISGRTFTWSSSDEAIATVSATGTGGGEVRAIGPGSVTITATSGGVSGSAGVEVDQVVTAISIDPEELTLGALGDTTTLSATALDRNGHEVAVSSFTWSSADEDKATVTASGRVKAIAAGNTTVTATADDVDGTAQVHVAPQVASIEVTPANPTVAVGGTVELAARGLDSAGNEVKGVTFTWKSADAEIARVNADGLVTGVSVGEGVQITATSGKTSGSATVDVTPAPVATVTVTPGSASVQVGTTRQLSAVLSDAVGNEISGPSISWSSSNDAVATVSADGLVTGVQVGGPVEISATSEGKTGTASISVISTEPPASTTMSPGNDYTCALTSTGRAYCWGNNADGQLGNGTLTDSDLPLPVQGGHVFESISSGSSHVCALKADGTVHCWGQNSASQLGDGTSTRRTAPVAVTGGLTFHSVSSGSAHSCALTPVGKAYCWGDNSEGQLGDGTSTERAVPTAVAGDLRFQQISAGYGYTCATTVSNEPYCWGYNASGQIGDGSTTKRLVPTKVSGGLAVIAVEAGANFSCAITVAHKAYCWGRNADGQLGDGSTTQSSTPVAVTGGLMFEKVDLGVDHACALSSGGEVHCWGLNLGLLGNGDTARSTQPVPVAGGHTFESMGVGRQHSCAVTSAGTAYCWGENSNGQLGDGTTTDRSTPVAVSGGQTYAVRELIRQLFASARDAALGRARDI